MTEQGPVASWPSEAAFIPSSGAELITDDGAARFAGVAVCNDRGEPTLEFVPGQTAHFFYMYEVLRDLETPIGGFSFKDASGLVIHGKTTLQYASQSPNAAPAGSRLRFHLELQLNISPGDYWFSVGLSSTNSETFQNYCFGDLKQHDLEQRLCVHCRIQNLGPFVILAEPRGKLLFHGLVDLPGNNSVSILGAGEDQSSSRFLDPIPPRQLEPSPISREFPGHFENSKLVHLASYPRSGNTWVRNLVEFYFDRRVSSIYREGQENFGMDGHDQNELFVDYRNLHQPVKTHRKLMNGVGDVLTNELRQLLPNVGDHFLVKTHELPYEQYVPGESAVYIVRHPGAVIWSYYKYLQIHNSETSGPITLDDAIVERVPFGSWSAHVEAWLKAGEALGSRFLMIRFEALSADENAVCQRLSQLTGLPRRGYIGTFPSFEYWHQQSPEFFSAGESEDWRPRFSAEELELICQLHGETARQLGYELNIVRS